MARIVRPPIDFALYGGSYDTVFGRYPRAIVDLIVATADGNDRPPVLDLAVLIHESGGGLNPLVETHTEPGDIAGALAEDSWGIAQIETRQNAGRGDGRQYLGLDGLVLAYERFLNPRWGATWRAMGRWGEWANNPVVFLDEFAPRAQGSINWPDDTRPGWWDNSLAGRRFTEAYVLLDVRWQTLLREAREGQRDAHVCPPLSDPWLLQLGLAHDAARIVTALLGTATEETYVGVREVAQRIVRTIDVAGGEAQP